MRLPESPLDLACLLCTTWQDSLFLCHIRAVHIPGNYLPLYLLHKIEASQYQWFGRPVLNRNYCKMRNPQDYSYHNWDKYSGV